MPSNSVADTIMAWDIKGEVAHAQEDLGPYYGGDIIKRIVIRCRDGEWTVPKPAPPTPRAVPLPFPGSGPPEDRQEP